ncbi:type II toxin-antitoxin system VapC family toxin [Aureimonas leprariae]|uniref:Type II toxin-antitoxin system VapC family toxin n=1 Tax=Plantimonas leprariae TaxID=2615207 RepID=A0A7V7PQ40_9HYPH|nr:type II toxin-antitoxin system VapC family toxin [Aureimonas leprariae]KAB0680112.1 type II toxin-antitoxin system VapC family toxin [Aureimonas leprariae]
MTGYLVDTHLLVWAADETERLSKTAAAILSDPASDLAFSVVALWELVIKTGLGRSVIRGDIVALRRQLLARRYRELQVTADHAFAVAALPPLHGDPFDRLMIAQARAEGLTLLTSDAVVARYPGMIERV